MTTSSTASPASLPATRSATRSIPRRSSARSSRSPSATGSSATWRSDRTRVRASCAAAAGRTRAGSTGCRVGLSSRRSSRTSTTRCASRTEEIFGPVVAVIPYDGVDEAVAITNDPISDSRARCSPHDEHQAFDVACRLRTGHVGINRSGWTGCCRSAASSSRASDAAGPRRPGHVPGAAVHRAARGIPARERKPELSARRGERASRRPAGAVSERELGQCRPRRRGSPPGSDRGAAASRAGARRVTSRWPRRRRDPARSRRSTCRGRAARAPRALGE